MARKSKSGKATDKVSLKVSQFSFESSEEPEDKIKEEWERLLEHLLYRQKVDAAQWVLKEKIGRPLEVKDLIKLIQPDKQLPTEVLPLIYEVLEGIDSIDEDFLDKLLHIMSSTGTYWGRLSELIIKFDPPYDKVRTFITDCIQNRIFALNKIENFFAHYDKDIDEQDAKSWLKISLERGRLESADKLAKRFFKRNLSPREVRIALRFGIRQADKVLSEQAYNCLNTTWNKADCEEFLRNKIENYKTGACSIVELIETAKRFEKEFNWQIDRGIWRDIARLTLDRAEEYLREKSYKLALELLSTYDLSEYLCRDYVRLDDIRQILIEEAKALMLNPEAECAYDIERSQEIFKFCQIYRLETEFVDQVLCYAKNFKQSWNSKTLAEIARYGASQGKIDELYREGKFTVEQADVVGVSIEAKEARLASLINSDNLSDLPKIEWLCQNIGRGLTLEEVKILVAVHQHVLASAQ